VQNAQTGGSDLAPHRSGSYVTFVFENGTGHAMDVVLGPLFRVLLIVIELYMWVIIIGVILSWLVAFNVINTQNRFVYMVGDFTHRATEPLLGPIRRALPNFGGLDISPLVLILGLIFLKGVLHNIYFQIVA